MKVFKLPILVILLSIFSLDSYSEDNSCDTEYLGKISSCTEYSCMINEKVSSNIHGRNEDGTCLVIMDEPVTKRGKQLIQLTTCNFSDKMLNNFYKLSRFEHFGGFDSNFPSANHKKKMRNIQLLLRNECVNSLIEEGEVAEFKIIPKVKKEKSDTEVSKPKTPVQKKSVQNREGFLPKCGLSFVDKILKCESSYKCEMPKPLVNNFITKHLIVGMNEDKTCKMFKTLSGDSGKEGMLCNYSNKSLKAFSRIINKTIAGKVAASTDKKIIEEAIVNECVING